MGEYYKQNGGIDMRDMVTELEKFDFPKETKKKDKLGDRINRIVRSRYNDSLESRFDVLLNNAYREWIDDTVFIKHKDRFKVNFNEYIFECICNEYEHLITTGLKPGVEYIPYHECLFLFELSVIGVATHLRITNEKVKEALEYGCHSTRSRLYMNICNDIIKSCKLYDNLSNNKDEYLIQLDQKMEVYFIKLALSSPNLVKSYDGIKE